MSKRWLLELFRKSWRGLAYLVSWPGNARGSERFPPSIRKDLLRFLNHEEILTSLRQKKLLTEDEVERFCAFEGDTSVTREEKNDFILRAVEAKLPLDPDTRLKFRACLKSEFQHLGHYQYLANLLEYHDAGDAMNKLPYTNYNSCERELISIDEELEKRIQHHQDFLKDIDFRMLVPVMRSKHLLTDTERDVLFPDNDLQHHSQYRKVIRLILILKHKSPTAHVLFLECLQEENKHPTHQELYVRLSYGMSLPNHTQNESICGKKRRKESAEITPAKIQPKLYEMEGILASKEYRLIMRKFQTWHHNGNWAEIDQQLALYKQEAKFPKELLIVAMLETAISHTFRQTRRWFSVV